MRNPRFSTVMGLLQEGHMQRLRGRKVAAQTGNFYISAGAHEG